MNDAAGIGVLHVDDDPDFVEVAAEMLEREDDRFTVETATSASDGLDRLAATDVDCIVSDYQMPGRNGIEFLEAVRDDYPEVPFILYTGKGSEAVAGDAIAAGATDYLQKESGTGQYELLANRIQNAVEQFRDKQRRETLERIRTLVNNINQALVRAESRSTVETQVCEIISDADPYLFAWIGEVDPDTDRIEPRASAGIEQGYLDDITVTTDDTPTGHGPGGTAVRERRVAVSQNVREDPDFGQWREETLERGYHAVASVPLEYQGTLYGVLGVYSERSYAFDEDERELLAELGSDIAHAIHSLELRGALREERDRRQAMFENAPSPVIAGEVDDAVHRITDVNDAFEEVFGYESDGVVGANVAEVIIPDGEMEDYEQIRERAMAGETTTTEVDRMTADGLRKFLLHVIPYGTDGGPPDGTYAWYTDITERIEREQQFESLFDNAPLPIAYTEFEDGAPIVRDVNATFERTFGYDAETAVGQNIDDLTVPSDRDSGASSINQQVRAGDQFEGEVQRDTSNGLRDFLLHAVPLRPGESGECSYAIYHDITERKERERKLEARSTAMEASIDGIALLDDDETYTFVNQAHAEVYGYDGPDAFLGEGWHMCYTEDERDRLAESVLPEMYEEGSWRGEAVGQRQDGTLFPQELSLTMLDDGGLVCVVRDISDRTERERRLQRQKEKIKALHDVATEIDTCETTESIYELIVAAAESILEFDIAIADEATDEVLVPRAVSSDLSGEQYYSETPIDAEDNFAAKAYRTGESSVVADLRTHDVAPADSEFRSALTVPIGTHGVFQAVAETTDAFDDTDLELTELLVSHTESALDRLTHEQELRRQNERLEEFASVVSHDLRNPLNVAAGRLELVRQECDSPYLDDVGRAHDRMNVLIDDLLTLAQAGKRVDELEPIDLAGTSDGCWRTVATADSTLVTETEQTIQADQGQLKQLLENLIRNATEHGGDDVTVTVGDLGDRDGFYVADDGPGIAEDEREQVFEAGYSNADEGTGFGLSIVEEIADAHGWDVRVTDSTAGGARFEITGVEVADA